MQERVQPRSQRCLTWCPIVTIIVPVRVNAEALREIRLRSGFTGTELAELAGIDRAYLSHIEAGRKHPSPAVARKLAQALKVRLVAILADPTEVDR
jgi:transcriptional regulator with XRE-family HTH domain